MKFVLASKSPRRREILANFGYDFEVVTAETDESSDITDPKELVSELSYRKAKAVADTLPENRAVIGSDTVVFLNGEILGKPKSKEDARRMLKMLSGTTHKVYSGVTVLYGGRRLTRFCVTDVTFQLISDSEIEEYINTSEPYDKAGGYAIQGGMGRYITGINGCYFNVVGFPINTFFNMLKELGL